MPIHNPAYRPWTGAVVSEWLRCWTICTTGIRRAAKSAWLKRLMLAAFLPLLFFAGPFFLFEQSQRDPRMWQSFVGFVRNFDQNSILSNKLGNIPINPTEEEFRQIRHDSWSFLLLTMLRNPQAFLMVLVVGIVAPPLISQDLRTRAYLIYFSRPITRLEYIFGKVGVVAFFLSVISALPSLLLYLVGLLLSPSLGVAFETWDLPLRILLGTATMVVPTTLLALAISSLTLESRYAAFAWFAIWIIGHVTYSALTVMPGLESEQLNGVYQPGWRLLTSPYQVLGNVQAYIFGFAENPSMVTSSFLALVAVSLFSLAILFRRVNAPMRA
jgi:ABC-2 type transport system permease protein